jgi:hypothetical protein
MQHGSTALRDTIIASPLGPVFFAVTTQSVSLLPQFEHRKRSSISGTSPRPASTRALQIGLALMTARLAPDQHAGIAGAQCRARCRQIVRHGSSQSGYYRGRKNQLRRN